MNHVLDLKSNHGVIALDINNLTFKLDFRHVWDILCHPDTSDTCTEKNRNVFWKPDTSDTAFEKNRDVFWMPDTSDTAFEENKKIFLILILLILVLRYAKIILIPLIQLLGRTEMFFAILIPLIQVFEKIGRKILSIEKINENSLTLLTYSWRNFF